MKLHLIGGLSVLSFVLGALVFIAVLPAENRGSVGGQYVLVGLVLGLLFLSLGGLTALGARFRPTREPAGVTVSHESDELNRADRGEGGSVGEPTDLVLDSEPVLTRPVQVVRFGGLGPQPALGWDLAEQVMAAVRRHEENLIDSLVDEGMLTTEGPITQGDVRAMVWVAVSSIELTDTLLTDLAGPVEVEAADLYRPGELPSGE